MTDTKKGEVVKAEQPELSPELVQRFAQMAMAIPEDSGDATERIVAQILSAETVDELDAPWDVSKAGKIAGHVLKITSLKRVQSSFKGGLGIFLVAEYFDAETGEGGTFTTGSSSVVAQLARAFHLGGLPIFCELVIAERESNNGFRPHHLKMHKGII